MVVPFLGGCDTLGGSSGALKMKVSFLGGLNLHFNHLIQSQVGISYWLFGPLPIGLPLSNLYS